MTIDNGLVAKTIGLYTERCEGAAEVNGYQPLTAQETSVFSSVGLSLQKNEKESPCEYVLTLPISLKRLNDLLGETALLSSGDEFYFLPPNVARIVDRRALDAGINTVEAESAYSVRVACHLFGHAVGFMKLYGCSLQR